PPTGTCLANGLLRDAPQAREQLHRPSLSWKGRGRDDRPMGPTLHSRRMDMGLRTGWQMALLAGLLVGSGCAHSPQVAEQEEPESTFRIGREDVLDISVWRDPDLSRTLPVRPDGMISLPLLGDVQAEGQTPDELAQKLRQGLAPYIQDPRVSVIVREVNSTRVYVTGEVAQPGAYA